MVRYQLTRPEILAACGLMREVLVRRLSRWHLAAAAHADDSRSHRGRALIPNTRVNLQ